MAEETHRGSCSCESCSPQGGRREFLKNISFGGALLAGIPQLASAQEKGFSRESEWSSSRTLKSGKAQRITLLHTADIHSQLHVHDEFFWENGKAVYKKRGGFATLKTMINTLRAKNPSNTLVIDGGDCFQGAGVASLSEGQAIIPLINNIGYDLMLPGNWEVAYGKDMMQRDLGGYDAQKVCANMFHDTGDAFHDEYIFHPYWTRSFGDFKIGFIGYNDPLTPKRQSPDYSKGIRFTKPEQNVARYVKLLRDYEKCDMVFILAHMGLAQQVDLANKPAVEGVDFILGADTHERVRKPIKGAYSKVTEPGAFGSFVAQLDIILENGVAKDTNYQLLDVDPARYKPDPEMLALIETARKPYRQELDRVIGRTKSTLVRYYVLENPMDNLITDAIQWKFKPDISLSNGFRFCPPLVVDPQKGHADITNDFLWSMLPVDSEAKTGEITGEQLWNWMEKELHNVFAKEPAQRFGGWVVRFSGMEVDFTAYRELGQRLNRIKVKGEPVDRKRMYTIVACEREGDPDDTLCRIEKVSNPRRLNATLHNVVREYLAVHSPVSPKVQGRVTASDVPQNLLSQLEGYDYEFR